MSPPNVVTTGTSSSNIPDSTSSITSRSSSIAARPASSASTSIMSHFDATQPVLDDSSNDDIKDDCERYNKKEKTTGKDQVKDTEGRSSRTCTKKNLDNILTTFQKKSPNKSFDVTASNHRISKSTIDPITSSVASFPKSVTTTITTVTETEEIDTRTGSTSNNGGESSSDSSCDTPNRTVPQDQHNLNITKINKKNIPSSGIGIINHQSLLVMMQDTYYNDEDYPKQEKKTNEEHHCQHKKKADRQERQQRRPFDDYKNEYDQQDELMLAAANAALNDTSWGEVCGSCCVHSPKSWFIIIGYWILVLACFYIFGLGLEFLGSGAKVMTGCVAGELFGISSHSPMGGVAIGILSTVLLQSSSTTTSIIVGLVGANDSIFTVNQGIYMVMGANIGTTITNTIVALLQFQNQHQLANAFAGATVHDIFNFLTVLVLLPLEASTGYLNHLTEALVRGSNTEKGDKWEGPVKKLISPLADKILIANKGLTNAVAGGGSCNDFYPILCEDEDNPTYHTCERFGLIACDKHTDSCPLFFDPNADVIEDKSAGLVVLCMGLFLIFVSLYCLVQVMTRLLTGVSLRIIHKATSLNGYFLIFTGIGITTLLQSSSTTTSFLTPMVGIGALRLEQMFPLTVGANIGTTITAIMAAMVTDGDAALQVALAHLMFNITGMLIWYPILSFRRIPVIFATRLGQYARVWRPFTLLYLFGAFIILPLVCLGISALFHHHHHPKTWKIIGAIITSLLVLLLVFWMRWCYFSGGRAKVYKYMSHQHNRYITLQTITTDMEHIKDRINFHEEYAGIKNAPLRKIVTRTSKTRILSAGEKLEEAKGLEGEYSIANKETCVESVTSTDSPGAKRSQKEPGNWTQIQTSSNQKSVREALQTVAEDMEYLKAGLVILNHYTGMPDYSYDDYDEESSSSDNAMEASSKGFGDDDGDDDIEASNFIISFLRRQKKRCKRGERSIQGERRSDTDLRSVVTSRSTFVTSVYVGIPRTYVIGFVISCLLFVWGIIALFDHGGKASIGAAYFLIAIVFISVFLSCTCFDSRSIHAYLRNLDRRKRRETVNALPTDVPILKRKLGTLLKHYRINVDSVLLGFSCASAGESFTQESHV